MRISFPNLGLLSLALLNANCSGEGGAEASYDAERSDDAELATEDLGESEAALRIAMGDWLSNCLNKIQCDTRQGETKQQCCLRVNKCSEKSGDSRQACEAGCCINHVGGFASPGLLMQ